MTADVRKVGQALLVPQESVQHTAHAVRVVQSGFVRWYVRCGLCQKTYQPEPPGRIGAARLAKFHNDTGRWKP